MRQPGQPERDAGEPGGQPGRPVQLRALRCEQALCFREILVAEHRVAHAQRQPAGLHRRQPRMIANSFIF